MTHLIYTPKKERTRGFTLVETLVAITFLMVAIVAPMTLTARSLSAAYYARDQITAFHLAQEAIEAVRHIRDANVLRNALGESVDLLTGIPSNGQSYTVDTIDGTIDSTACSSGTCPPLQTDGNLYGYETGWAATRFTRTVTTCFMQSNGACNSTVSDEVRVSVTVTWISGSFQSRSFTISENLYRWIEDGSAAS